ncbi:MAG: hypothetical protein GEV03_13645 [Streptosporangiales bacterium]|nr:hypothetical protein [Streptosporangiales bacterium]
MPVVMELTRTSPDTQEPIDDLFGGVPAGGVVRGDDPPGEGDGGGEPRRNWPLGLAVAVIVVLAALLTYLGMLTQVWANLSGAQLPGA